MGRRQIVKRFLTEANLFLNYSALNNFMNVVLICYFPSQIFVFCHTLKQFFSFCPTLWWWNKTRNIYVVFYACTSSPTTKPSGSFPCSWQPANQLFWLTRTNRIHVLAPHLLERLTTVTILKCFSPSVSGTLRLWLRIQF